MNLEDLKKNIPQTILKYAIPSIIAMLLTSSITIIDGLFIGNYIGKEALTAVNLGLPILYIFLAFGIMLGVGGSAIATRLLGNKKPEWAVSVFNQTVLITVICLSSLSLFFLCILELISNSFIGNELVRSFFNKYYFIMLFVYPLMIVNTNFGMFIRGEGKPEVFMVITIISIFVNTLLDYIFIAVFNMGIHGIAYASLVSVVVGVSASIGFLNNKSRVFKFNKFSFSRVILIETLLNGSSELIGQISMSITMFALNYVILKEVGINGVAAFTVVGYTSYLFNMIVIGFGQGASPVISYSYGANELALCKGIRNKTTLYVFLLGLLILVVLNIFPSSYSYLFIKNQTVQNMIMAGIPIFSLAFLFMGINIISSFYFTSIGEARQSAIISASRGLVVLMICIFVFPFLWGMTGVWLIAPVTELMTLFLSFIFIFRHDRFQKNMEQSNPKRSPILMNK